ncbi:ATP-binding protein [Bacillus sp. FJAT-45037]|uniref:ATP-binding protein n=1 Tax=Bacillus sp. FJAT-45037 TaxID=2011007 RepID=UPI000C238965|nr:ATP-binding protein [Bacillus sp. FJAT-45037]
MIRARTQLPSAIQAMISDSNIIDSFTCTGCVELITVRRVVMPFGPEVGKERDILYGCRCEDLEMASIALKKRKEAEEWRLSQLFDQNSLVNRDLQLASFDSYKPDSKSQQLAFGCAQHYVREFTRDSPRNLILTGSFGVGKSHLALAVAKGLIDKGHSAIFVSVPKLLTKLKATYNKNSELAEDELLCLLEKVDCLVLDDIGAENGSSHSGSWSTSKIFEVLDRRMGKHTIFTTNLNGRELQEKVGARNFSRMMHQTEVVTLTGSDYRLRHFMQKEREMRK